MSRMFRDVSIWAWQRKIFQGSFCQTRFRSKHFKNAIKNSEGSTGRKEEDNSTFFFTEGSKKKNVSYERRL